MIILYKPKLEDLWFREQFMSDPETMSYNHAWGGTIPFPKDRWSSWYDYWLVHHDNKRFYRYLQDSESDAYVGEIAYHYDNEREIWVADVIVASEYRGKGYGGEGLRLLCDYAANNGVDVLRDDIAIDNPAIKMFLKAGFIEEYRTNEIIMLKKVLSSRISNEDINWFSLSHEEKNHQLFLKQKALLDQFLEKGAISQAQHDKSLYDLIEKMGETY